MSLRQWPARGLSVVCAMSLAVGTLGCNLIPGLGGPAPGPQTGIQAGSQEQEMTVAGTALFPGGSDPKAFAPIAGAEIEVFEPLTGAKLGSGTAGNDGTFAIKVMVKTNPADTLVGVRARASRATTYRIANTVTFEVAGLGGSVDFTIDPATAVAAAKFLAEAKARGTVSFSGSAFGQVAAKIRDILAAADIASAVAGTASAAALFDTLAQREPSLGTLFQQALAGSGTSAASPTPTPTPTPTPSSTPTTAATQTVTFSGELRLPGFLGGTAGYQTQDISYFGVPDATIGIYSLRAAVIKDALQVLKYQLDAISQFRAEGNAAYVRGSAGGMFLFYQWAVNNLRFQVRLTAAEKAKLAKARNSVHWIVDAAKITNDTDMLSSLEAKLQTAIADVEDAMPAPVGSGQTDANGKFSIQVPKSDVSSSAAAYRTMTESGDAQAPVPQYPVPDGLPGETEQPEITEAEATVLGKLAAVAHRPRKDGVPAVGVVGLLEAGTEARLSPASALVVGNVPVATLESLSLAAFTEIAAQVDQKFNYSHLDSGMSLGRYGHVYTFNYLDADTQSLITGIQSYTPTMATPSPKPSCGAFATTAPAMATNPTKKQLTYQDYAALPDDGKRYELIDGELALCPAPTLTHQRLLLRLSFLVQTFLESHPIGEEFFAPADVVLDIYQVLQPDLLFVRNERSSVLTEANVQGAPDLVVEILSPGTTRRDLGRKRELYDQYGVREYWIVHQNKPCIEILRPGVGGKLLRVAKLGPGDGVESPVLPGFVDWKASANTRR